MAGVMAGVMQRLADLYKMLQRTVLLMRPTTSGLEHTMWTSRPLQTTSQSLGPPQVCQVHAWRMVQCAWHPLKSNFESPHFKLNPQRVNLPTHSPPLRNSSSQTHVTDYMIQAVSGHSTIQQLHTGAKTNCNTRPAFLSLKLWNLTKPVLPTPPFSQFRSPLSP